MMTLVEFLQARLAEDALTALAAVDSAPHWRSDYQYRDVKDQDGHYVVQADSRHPSVGQAAHIARHSPARVLAEVGPLDDGEAGGGLKDACAPL